MREKIDDSQKKMVVEMRMAGEGIATVAEKAGLRAETVAANWKRWQRDLGMDIPNRQKREAVTLIENGLNPDQAAAQTGLNPDTVMRQWRKWQKEVRAELPEYLRKMVAAKVEDTEPEEVVVDEEDEILCGTGAEEKAVEVPEAERQEVQVDRRRKLAETIRLIRAVDELAMQYLESGQAVEAVSIWIDEDNRFDLCTETHEDGSVSVELTIRIKAESEEA